MDVSVRGLVYSLVYLCPLLHFSEAFKQILEHVSVSLIIHYGNFHIYKVERLDYELQILTLSLNNYHQFCHFYFISTLCLFLYWFSKPRLPITSPISTPAWIYECLGVFLFVCLFLFNFTTMSLSCSTKVTRISYYLHITSLVFL